MTVPVGTIVMWGGNNNIPPGWLECDGTLQSSATYPTLASIIGSNFGQGAPAGQFYLPDLRGRFIRGVDGGMGRDPDSASRVDMQTGNEIGPLVGSIQSHAFQNHTHPYNSFPGSSGSIASGTYWQASQAETGQVDQPQYQTSSETRPINAYLYFIIKAE